METRGRGKVAQEASSAHFTLGNDERVMRSSYQTDFGGVRAMRSFRCPRPEPPKPAKILPSAGAVPEHCKWFSSTRIDFGHVTAQDRQAAYEMSRSDFRATKELQIRDLGLLRDNHSAPAFSKYRQDYRPSAYCMPQMLDVIRLSERAHKLAVKRNAWMISEARSAFRWPSAARVKLPSHIRSRSQTA
ncbi:uncharacterized protein LOC128235556 [Mya arenaria]|uniref:uncharacterized protein LOC128235556 n=1 Tax=Mya arenaria TaxID=6604 RepID=UPI0022E2DB72|nr:uncharacterized protein LOC128235556 [Mya arenaria]